MIDYRIEVANLHAHLFKVTMTVPQPCARQRVSLPVWIPGSYLVREFARHLSPLAAQQGEASLSVHPIDKATWEVDCHDGAPLTISYEVYAFDTSVRAAFLDSRRGFFNGTSVFLCVEGQEALPHKVRITGLPKGWEVATGLAPVKVNKLGVGDYHASDYDALVDHPVELGPFWRGHFKARGVPHELVVSGASPDFDGERLLADARSICEAQIVFWHGRRKAPFDRYVFLLNAVEDGYGGLEHRNSTALICSRKDLPRTGRTTSIDAYQTLLGLISHEYFHTWNVKRIKPKEFAPYDYSQENHTRMLWFFEGFTSYYDDQFLLRTGLIDAKAYLKLLSKTVNQVHATPGRHRYSVAQASFDAWTRYYRPDENTANATVSYYTKGSLVALALDLSLRQLTPAEGALQPTLDGVMKRLWQLGRPIDEDDVAQALEAEAGQPPTAAGVWSWKALMQEWVHGTRDLPLQALVQAFGVRWTCKTGSPAQRLGMRVSDSSGVLKVQAVMRGSLAETAGLSAGDELIALDGWRLRRPDDLTQWIHDRQAQRLLVCRDQQIMTLLLPPSADAAGKLHTTMGEQILLTVDDKAVDAQASRRDAWLLTN